MNVSEHTAKNLTITSWVWTQPAKNSSQSTPSTNFPKAKKTFDLLHPVRQWLDSVDVNSPEMAHRLCQLIPAQCPFEREIKLFGRTLFHIPPMCKLNPLYEEVVALRFRALCYLADECGEDISAYC
ncbi:Mo-dependent nitrogenase C-terminal domain-containing protein [Allocoleopsis franciscana]|uniref:Mo-dependent nitrogenase n=1 Tax=Allocoleopsis franciscana PCC 7113 TaxID=1173027 RepID=K9WJR3_9CYAN|nr:Mo-dependent nitrogenase C-terminal domain-containing protein [Allocoleopsis franciscana]AFZ20009.1 Mo-dependent nitrogenase [Allocoleopsis franciscana PCC 7113]